MDATENIFAMGVSCNTNFLACAGDLLTAMTESGKLCLIIFCRQESVGSCMAYSKASHIYDMRLKDFNIKLKDEYY